MDRAGLDAAIALGLPYGGWVPSGRMAEDGVVPPIYEGMEEYSTPGYPARTKANVRDSDATLILVESLPLSKGTALTLRTAENIRKPHKVVCSVETHGRLPRILHRPERTRHRGAAPVPHDEHLAHPHGGYSGSRSLIFD